MQPRRVLRNGEGVAQDLTKAVQRYQRAADLGDANAMFNLGVCYQKGCGVRQDRLRARQLYAEAARRGNLQASDVLELRSKATRRRLM